ncbi:MAG TPA: DUF3298 domain-containing protein [Pyrinomonadaceae bacterium]|nr:DUF3298 domain-containing protein [Pyrinomonadaceae bacterium]
MKKVFSWLMAGTFILGVLSPAGTMTTHAAVAASSQARRAAAVRFVQRQIKEANRKLRYTIAAKYPQTLGVRANNLAQLNTALKNLITEQINGFKKDFQPPEERMGTMGSSFDSGYTVELATDDLVSINFGISTYFEGAAHPNYNAVTFNYWLGTGQTLSLGDLFKPGVYYLDIISSLSIKALRKRLGPEIDDDWIQKGAGAAPENYKSWNITRRGLKITFDPYQVASYAQGPQEVIIPYSSMKSIIDPSGPLGKLR